MTTEQLYTLLPEHLFALRCKECGKGVNWCFAIDPHDAKCAVESFILEHHGPGHTLRASERAPNDPRAEGGRP